MNLQETTKLLAYIVVFEPNRDPEDFAVLVWHDILKNVHYDDAMEAVREYYRRETWPIKPASIIEGARRHRTTRISRLTRIVAAKVTALGGEMPTNWNRTPVEDEDLARIGLLIETNDPAAEAEVRAIVESSQRQKAEIEAGRRYFDEHRHELIGRTL